MDLHLEALKALISLAREHFNALDKMQYSDQWLATIEKAITTLEDETA
jgi:hypothetical protein